MSPHQDPLVAFSTFLQGKVEEEPSWISRDTFFIIELATTVIKVTKNTQVDIVLAHMLDHMLLSALSCPLIATQSLSVMCEGVPGHRSPRSLHFCHNWLY